MMWFQSTWKNFFSNTVVFAFVLDGNNILRKMAPCLRVWTHSVIWFDCECRQSKLGEKLWELSITALSSFEQLVVDSVSPNKLSPILPIAQHRNKWINSNKATDASNNCNANAYMCARVRYCVYVMPVMWLTWSAQILWKYVKRIA